MSVAGVGASRFMKVRADPISRLLNWWSTLWEGCTCDVYHGGEHSTLGAPRDDTLIVGRRILEEGEGGPPSALPVAQLGQQQR